MSDDDRPSASYVDIQTYAIPSFGTSVAYRYDVREGRILWGTVCHTQAFGPSGVGEGLSITLAPQLETSDDEA
jgi:hypothetical protein